jgi:WD40 repeat protein
MVKLWDVNTGKQGVALKARLTATVLCVAFSSNCKLLAAGCEDGTIRLWEVATGNEFSTIKGLGAGVRSVAFSPDDKLLASGGDDKTIRLWRLVPDK